MSGPALARRPGPLAGGAATCAPRVERRGTFLKRLFLTFGLFALFGLALIRQALDYPMVYDDLHLIRSFSNAELIGAFSQSWDLDHIETPGLRPFLVLFNDIRYAAFGENVTAHRLLLVFMYAGYLTAIAWIAGQFGLAWGWSVLAGLLFMGAKYSVNHYIWLIDGAHLLQGLAFAAGVIFLLRGLQHRHQGLLALSVGCLAVCFMTREEGLVAIPIACLIGAAYLRRNGMTWRGLPILYAASLAASGVFFLIWRAICIPQATFHWNLLGVIYDILLMPNVLGVTPVDLATRILIYGWIFMVLAVTIVQYVLRRALPWRLPTLWLLCALVACLPGLQLARPNLLFFPMTFSTLFLCAVLAGISRSSAPLKAVVAGILVCALAGEFYVSSLTMQSFHPDSITAIAWNAELIYPASGVQVHIPADRWAAQAQQLAALGIHSAAEAKLRIPQLTAQAKAGRHYSPGPDGVPFLPLLQAIAQP